MKFIYLFIFIVPVLFSCASHHQKPEHIEKFVTEINTDNVKRFTFSMEMAPVMGRGGKPPSGGMGGPPPGGKNGPPPSGGKGGPGGMSGDLAMGGRKGEYQDPMLMRLRLEERVYERLAGKLLETGYCRDGYIDLAHTIDFMNSEIQGECKDEATAQDVEKFPNVDK